MQQIDWYHIKELDVTTLKFQVPLNHKYPNSGDITICGRLVKKWVSKDQPLIPGDANLLFFLQGGPGFGCPAPLSYSGFVKEILDRGFQCFLLDQRGTGLSSSVDTETLFDRCGNDVTSQLDYILNFRADSIIADCEIVRRCLLGDDGQISLLGHSFGGFCSVTYLSLYPQSLKQVIIAGGIPPLSCTPDEVYSATYRRTAERNVAYYKRYPEDVEKVHEICAYLSSHDVTLPNGGRLSVDRFQHLGMNFGSTGRTDALHQLVFKIHYELSNLGKILYATRLDIQNSVSFDTNVLYFLLQEAIYCERGVVSNWAAERLRREAGINFDYSRLINDGPMKSNLESAVYFTGEMVFRSMYRDYAELRDLKPIAEAIHSYGEWDNLYNKDMLANNVVPAVAATYVHDQYVDFGLSMLAKSKIAGLRQYITSEFFHNGFTASPEIILPKLFHLLEEDVI